MRITVLAASGGTGRQLAQQALDRGHHVTALARDLGRLDLPTSERLRRVVADVRDPASIAAALEGTDVVVSGLGTAKGDGPGTLTAGAQALVKAGPPRIVWLGAFGTGRSAPVAGPITRRLLALVLGAEIPDKVEADGTVLAAGGTVLHAGPLSNGPLSAGRRTLTLPDMPRRLLVKGISRATVAAAMLDEAESGLHAGQVVVPLTR